MYRSGNVLFLILLAVALFAALSYAVTQAGRSSGKDISDEKLSLEVNELLSFSNAVKAAILRMKLISGCKDTEISFQSSEWFKSTFYDNPNSPADHSCHVFHPEGGGVAFKDILRDLDNVLSYDTSGDPSTYAHIFSGKAGVLDVGANTNQGPIGNELILIVHVNENFCRLVNEKLGVISAGESLPIDDQVLISTFQGVYASNGHLGWHNGATGKLSGVETGCFVDRDPSPVYLFYDVYIAR